MMNKNRTELAVIAVFLMLHFLFKQIAAEFIFDLYLSLLAGVALAAIAIFLTNIIYRNNEK